MPSDKHLTWQQSTLIRAAFGGPEVAERAWNEWRANTDLSGHVGSGTFRLLPQLYRNLRALGLPAESLALFKGVYRKTWYRNQLLLERALPAVDALSDASIDAVVLDAPMFLGSSEADLGGALLGQLELLVPRVRFLESARLLAELGWKTGSGSTERLLDSGLPCTMKDSRDHKLRLHNQVPGGWGSGRPLPPVRSTLLRGTSLSLLGTEGQFLLACSGPTVAVNDSHFYRVGAALGVLSSAVDPVDWSWTLGEAVRMRRSAAVCHVVESIRACLGDVFALAQPSDMRAMSVSKVELREGRLLRQGGWLGGAGRLWYAHSRASGDAPTLSKVTSFGSYLMAHWALDRQSELPAAIYEALRRRASEPSPTEDRLVRL